MYGTPKSMEYRSVRNTEVHRVAFVMSTFSFHTINQLKKTFISYLTSTGEGLQSGACSGGASALLPGLTGTSELGFRSPADPRDLPSSHR